jgi:hypothetical protein
MKRILLALALCFAFSTSALAQNHSYDYFGGPGAAIVLESCPLHSTSPPFVAGNGCTGVAQSGAYDIQSVPCQGQGCGNNNMIFDLLVTNGQQKGDFRISCSRASTLFKQVSNVDMRNLFPTQFGYYNPNAPFVTGESAAALQTCTFDNNDGVWTAFPDQWWVMPFPMTTGPYPVDTGSIVSRIDFSVIRAFPLGSFSRTYRFYMLLNRVF